MPKTMQKQQQQQQQPKPKPSPKPSPKQQAKSPIAKSPAAGECPEGFKLTWWKSTTSGMWSSLPKESKQAWTAYFVKTLDRKEWNDDGWRLFHAKEHFQVGKRKSLAAHRDRKAAEKGGSSSASSPASTAAKPSPKGKGRAAPPPEEEDEEQ